MKRRDFLYITAGGIAITAAASTGMGCAAKRHPLATAPEKTVAVPGLDADGMQILHYASLAPSSHNSQPWYVQVQDAHTWIIGWDAQRRLPVVDPDGREMLLSLGCFVENLVQAAGALGYEASVDITAKDMACSDVATVRLKKATASAVPLERITRRRTLRKHYLNTPIEDKHLGALMAPLAGECAFFRPGEPQTAWLQTAVLESFTRQTWNRHAQKELAQWIRFRTLDAEKLRDGLTSATMEIDGFAGFWVRTFMNSDDVTGESFRQKGIDLTAEQVKQGGGWLAITSKGESPADLLDAGRRYEALCLLLREQGIAAHPMSQMLEEKPWRNQVTTELGLGERRVQFVLRLGYVEKYPEPVSLRRPVQEFILGNETQTPADTKTGNTG